MRVGVGVGAVMLGGGCDAITEAKARVLGEEAEVSVEAPIATAPLATAPVTPEPLLLGRDRDGVAGVVENVVKSDRAEPRPSIVPPIEDLGRPRTAPERPLSSEKPRTRTRPKPVRTAESEPCDPLAAPTREWVCGPCGRG